MINQKMTVKLRRDIGKAVKPEAEQLDGRTYGFRCGWVMDDNDPYPGETAYIPHDGNYPDDAPAWIAGGDLEER